MNFHPERADRGRGPCAAQHRGRHGRPGGRPHALDGLGQGRRDQLLARAAGKQFNRTIFGLNFGLKNHLSFGLRFPTVMVARVPIQLAKKSLEKPLEIQI